MSGRFGRSTAETRVPAGGGAQLKVLFVCPQFLPLVGGAEIRALREAIALQKLGHRVTVLTLRWDHDWPRTEAISGVSVHRVGGIHTRGHLRLAFGAQLVAEVALVAAMVWRHHEYDVVHLRQFSMLARPVIIAAALLRKPLLVRLGSAGLFPEPDPSPASRVALFAGDLDAALPHLTVPRDSWARGDISEFKRYNWPSSLWLWMLRRRRTRFIATSTRIREYLLHSGFASDQITVLPSGVDPAAVPEPLVAEGPVARANGRRALSVVCVARLSYEKGIDILLHAWREVHTAQPDARLILLGDGPLGKQLRALADSLGVVDAVDFRGTVGDVVGTLATSDVFVLPSRFEGMSNTLLEAMACGLPCVATRVSGSEDLIVDGESGLLVPPEDPDALAAALLALLGDRERARTLGAAARKRVTEHFNERDLVRRLAELYARVVAGQPVSGDLSSAAIPPVSRPDQQSGAATPVQAP